MGLYYLCGKNTMNKQGDKNVGNSYELESFLKRKQF